jgi:hypothetical protein
LLQSLTPGCGTSIAAATYRSRFDPRIFFPAAFSAAQGLTGVARDQFDLDSAFVTSVVFVSTLLCPLALVLLIEYLKG